jgi:hypothetical protein
MTFEGNWKEIEICYKLVIQLAKMYPAFKILRENVHIKARNFSKAIL